MSWGQIARAYETGWTPPPSSKKPRLHSGPKGSMPITVGGETRFLPEWIADPRNVHKIGRKTLRKRAEKPENLVSAEVFLRKPTTGRPEGE
jgi:hypothetical protein